LFLLIIFQQKPTIVSYSSSANTNNNNSNSHIKQNIHKASQQHRSVVINFDKYKVDNKPLDAKSETKTSSVTAKMVNKPSTPRKHHTFNENQSVYHKDSKNKLVLNNQTNKQQATTNDPSKPHVDVIYFKKPLTRTGSTLITTVKLWLDWINFCHLKFILKWF